MKYTDRGHLPAIHTCPFSLIELLVVIAIITILSSILLPVMSRVRYMAKNTACINQMHQISRGVMMYADDNDDYYPSSSPDGREHPSTLAYRDHFDLRPVYTDYMGATLNSTLKCPLAADQWRPSHYDTRDTEKFDIDGYGLSGTPVAKSTYSFYYNSGDSGNSSWKDEVPMERVGQAAKPLNTGQEHRLLMSDYMQYNTNTSQGIHTTHSGRGGGGRADGGLTRTSNFAWYFAIGLMTDANFCLDDGSVSTVWTISMDGEKAGLFDSYNPSNRAIWVPVDARK